MPFNEKDFHLHLDAVHTGRKSKMGGQQVRMVLYRGKLGPQESPTKLGVLQLGDRYAWVLYKILKVGASMVGAGFSTSGSYNGGHPASREGD